MCMKKMDTNNSSSETKMQNHNPGEEEQQDEEGGEGAEEEDKKQEEGVGAEENAGKKQNDDNQNNDETEKKMKIDDYDSFDDESVDDDDDDDDDGADDYDYKKGGKASEFEEELYVSMSNSEKDPMINLIVAGKKFCISRSSLLTFPQTMLGQLALRDKANQKKSKTYIFDRNPKMMSSILDLYRTGELHLPKNMCGIAIFRELRFWGIDDRLVSECCWQKYKEALKEIVVVDELEKIMGHNYNIDGDSIKSRIWLTMEKPGFNKASWVWFTIYMIFIGLSVIVVTLSTVDDFREGRDGKKVDDMSGQTVLERLLNTQLNTPLMILDTMGLFFFTFEPLLRICVAPELSYHMRQPLNLMDIALAIDHWACFIMERDQSMLDTNQLARIVHRIFRAALCFRVLRIFHVVRKYAKMKVILLTFKASSAELLLLLLGNFMAVIIYATLIYYAEMTQATDNFQNIPIGIWWAIITMTTVGYGDYYPNSVLGYIVGVCCSLSGLLLLSMPIAIIAGNFNTYYSGLVAREQRVRRAHYLAEGFSKRINPFFTIPIQDSTRPKTGKKSKETAASTTPGQGTLMNDFNITAEDLNPFRNKTNFSFVYDPQADSSTLHPSRSFSSKSINLGESAQYVNDRLFEGVETVKNKSSFKPISAIKNMVFRSLGDLSRYQHDKEHPFYQLVKSSSKGDSQNSIVSNDKVSRSTNLLKDSDQNQKNYNTIQYEVTGYHSEVLWSDEEIVDFPPRGRSKSCKEPSPQLLVQDGRRARSPRHLRPSTSFSKSMDFDSDVFYDSDKHALTSFSKSMDYDRDMGYDNDCMDITDEPIGVTLGSQELEASGAAASDTPIFEDIPLEENQASGNEVSESGLIKRPSKGKHKKKRKKGSRDRQY